MYPTFPFWSWSLREMQKNCILQACMTGYQYRERESFLLHESNCTWENLFVDFFSLSSIYWDYFLYFVIFFTSFTCALLRNWNFESWDNYWCHDEWVRLRSCWNFWKKINADLRLWLRQSPSVFSYRFKDNKAHTKKKLCFRETNK